jgi:hypothetical protein
MAEKDVQAVAQAANLEPRSRSLSTWGGPAPDRLLMALVFTDVWRPALMNLFGARHRFRTGYIS